MNNIPHIDKNTRKNMEALKDVVDRHKETLELLMASGGNMKIAMMKHPKKIMALVQDLQTEAKARGIDLKDLMGQAEGFMKSQGVTNDIPQGGQVVDDEGNIIPEKKGFFSKFKRN